MKPLVNNQAIEGNSVEVADILRAHIADYQEHYPLLPNQYKIIHNLLSCRTSVLGGRVEKCDQCGTKRVTYNSCRNRHCPKCQHVPRERWLEARKAELLPVPYFHNVFTLPHDLNPIVLFNKKVMLNILFKSVSETLLAFGKNMKNKLGGKLKFPGISAPLQKPGRFNQLKDSLYSKDWVVYMPKPIKRPEFVLEYLGRYTHRVAISNNRIVSLKDGMVTFRYKDRQKGQMLETTVTAVEFIRRFLLHSLPKRFVRIRHFGFLSNAQKTNNLRMICTFLDQPAAEVVRKSIEEMMLKLTGVDITRCPCCKEGSMEVVFELQKPAYSYLKELIRPPNLRKTA